MSSRNKRRNKSRNKNSSQSSNRQRQDHGQADGQAGGQGGAHGGVHDGGTDTAARAARSSTETKRSLRTTELALYVVAVLAVVMASLAVDANGEGGEDPFGAEQAIRYITFLTVGYMLARGLAKAGSHQRSGASGADVLDDDRADVDDVDLARATHDDTAAHVVHTDADGPRHDTSDTSTHVHDVTEDHDVTEVPAVSRTTDHDTTDRDTTDRDTTDHDTTDHDTTAADGTAHPEGAASDDDGPEGHLRLRKLEPRQ